MFDIAAVIALLLGHGLTLKLDPSPFFKRGKWVTRYCWSIIDPQEKVLAHSGWTGYEDLEDCFNTLKEAAQTVVASTILAEQKRKKLLAKKAKDV